MNSKVIQGLGWTIAVLVVAWVFFIIFWTVPQPLSANAVAPPTAHGLPPAVAAQATSIASSIGQQIGPAAPSGPPAVPSQPGTPAPGGNPDPLSPGQPPAAPKPSPPARRPNYVEKWDLDLDNRPIPTNVQ